MASSIETYVNIADNTPKELQNYMPKQTAIDKIGGIFCHICNFIFENKKQFDKHYAQHGVEGTEIVYTCIVCKKQISTYPSFRNHCYLNHVVKNKFQCQYCTKSFSKLSILNSHVSAVHDYKCASCDEKFSSKKDLEKHKIIHATKKEGKNEPPYKCATCNQEIASVDECEAHIDSHCEMLYPCPICKEPFPDKLEAIKHLTKHYDENITIETFNTTDNISEDSSIDILGGILCCHCDLLFPNRSEIDSHFVVEHEDKSIVYSCNICGKQFEKYNMFGDHCYLHAVKEKFQCDECEKCFPRLSLLVLHVEAFHTGAADKPFSCPTCGHGFMTQPRLREHRRVVHKEDGPIRCTKPGCSAVFGRPRELVAHGKLHALVPDTWCRGCGLALPSARAAQRHLDVHRRARYACPVCRRQYSARRAAAAHAPRHFALTLHVCRTCHRAFPAPHRLAAHLRTHAPRRAHACPLCPKTFAKPHELRQHTNVHTGRRPFACHLCVATFANRPNWAKHLARVHALDKTSRTRLRDHPPPAGVGVGVGVGTPAPAPDDGNDDIRAIVDHIDAMTSALEAQAPPPAPPPGEGGALFAEIAPFCDDLFGATGDSGVAGAWGPLGEWGPELAAGPAPWGSPWGDEAAMPLVDPRLAAPPAPATPPAPPLAPLDDHGAMFIY